MLHSSGMKMNYSNIFICVGTAFFFFCYYQHDHDTTNSKNQKLSERCHVTPCVFCLCYYILLQVEVIFLTVVVSFWAAEEGPASREAKEARGGRMHN